MEELNELMPLQGWKNITALVGRNKQTCKKYVRELNMPVIWDPGGRPVLYPDMYKAWLLKTRKQV